MTQLALVIDLNVCVGCHACVTSCKEWNTSGWAGPMTDQRPYGRDPSGTFFNRVQMFEESGAAAHVHVLHSQWRPGEPVWSGTIDGAPAALQVRVDIVHLAQGELDRFIDALALAEPDATRGPPRWRR